MRTVAVLLLLFASIAKGQPTTQVLDSFFLSYLKDNEPGGAVLIVKDNKIVYKKGFGIADIHTKEKITTSTLFNTGSVSKTFVAYGILKLASEGKLSLDDDLYNYFPDFSSPEIAKKVRLFHLLTHSSGLPDSRNVSANRDFYLYATDEGNFAPLKQTTALLFEPGTHYRYSNPAFNGLALVIEKVSGVKWQDYIREKIFLPSGMNMSIIQDGPHPASGVAHGYEKNKTGMYEELDYGEEPTFPAAGNGGVWSNVEELWKYEQAIRQFSFLDSTWIGKSRNIYPLPLWNDSIPSQLGLSWFTTLQSGQQMIGHTGTQGGFMADYCWIPQANLFFVMLCNRPVPRVEIREKLISLFTSRQNNH